MYIASTYAVRDVFGNIAEGFGDEHGRVRGYNPKNLPAEMAKQIPERDKDYTFREELLGFLLAWQRIKSPMGLFLTGETGSGKSTSIDQFCARIGMPLYSVDGHERLEPMDLLGGIGIKDKETYFREGPLTVAMKCGFWVLIDEYDAIHASTLIALNRALSSKWITIAETNESIMIHPDFRLVATGNTNGDGMSKHYIGTQQMNMANLDRFIMYEVPYPSEQEEQELIQKKIPFHDPSVIQKMIKVGRAIRTAYANTSGARSNVTMSIRGLIAWGELAHELSSFHKLNQDPLMMAFESVCLKKANQASRKAALDAFNEVFGGSV